MDPPSQIALTFFVLVTLGALGLALYWFVFRKSSTTAAGSGDSDDSCEITLSDGICDDKSVKKCARRIVVSRHDPLRPCQTLSFNEAFYTRQTRRITIDVGSNKVIEDDGTDNGTEVVRENVLVESPEGSGLWLYDSPCFDSNDGAGRQAGLTLDGCVCVADDETLISTYDSDKTTSCGSLGVVASTTFRLFIDGVEFKAGVPAPVIHYVDRDGTKKELPLNTAIKSRVFYDIQRGEQDSSENAATGELFLPETEALQKPILLTLEVPSGKENLWDVSEVVDSTDHLPPASYYQKIWKYRFYNAVLASPTATYEDATFEDDDGDCGGKSAGVCANITTVVDAVRKVRYLPVASRTTVSDGETVLADETSELASRPVRQKLTQNTVSYEYQYDFNANFMTSMELFFSQAGINQNTTIRLDIRKATPDDGVYKLKGYRFWSFNLLSNFGDGDVVLQNFRFYDRNGIQLLPIGWSGDNEIYHKRDGSNLISNLTTNADAFEDSVRKGIRAYGPHPDNLQNLRSAFADDKPLYTYYNGRDARNSAPFASTWEPTCEQDCPLFSKYYNGQQMENPFNSDNPICNAKVTTNGAQQDKAFFDLNRYQPRRRLAGNDEYIDRVPRGCHLGFGDMRLILEFEFSEEVIPKFYQINLQNLPTSGGDVIWTMPRSWVVTASDRAYRGVVNPSTDSDGADRAYQGRPIRSRCFWYSYDDVANPIPTIDARANGSRGRELFNAFMKTTDKRPTDVQQTAVDGKVATEFGYYVTRGPTRVNADACDNRAGGPLPEAVVIDGKSISTFQDGPALLEARVAAGISRGVWEGHGYGLGGAREIWELELSVNSVDQHTPNTDVGLIPHDRHEPRVCNA
jgi:hypothetical protein